ncbi:hypothetical protein LCGC14_1945060 [marine sediment metagenome]|uniref:NodB homology domain-containing protein n=1 Tax=marine sediment metagenome TaxID=412755 RepID=A0A0F9HXE3_9ZZZZ
MRVLILAYHRIYPGYHIDPGTFEYQIRVLKKHFVPLTLDEVAAFIRGDFNLKKNGFAITFDDGWADNFVYAYPILKKHEVPATLFIPTSFISNENSTRPTLEDYWNNKISYKKLFRGRSSDEAAAKIARGEHTEEFLTWDEINHMKPLVQIESHAHSHAYHFRSPKIIATCGEILKERQNWLLLSGIKLEPGMPMYESGSVLMYPRYYENENRFEDFDNYKKRIKAEFKTSIAMITKKTGRRPKHLAWPFGEYNKTVIEVAKESGLETCLTTRIGAVKQGDNPYELKRFSPPRNRRLFSIALKGGAGIVLYRLAVQLKAL